MVSRVLRNIIEQLKQLSFKDICRKEKLLAFIRKMITKVMDVNNNLSEVPEALFHNNSSTYLDQLNDLTTNHVFKYLNLDTLSLNLSST